MSMLKAACDELTGWLVRLTDQVVRRAHRPNEVGPPERVACFRCMEAWPCEELRRYEAGRGKRAGMSRVRRIIQDNYTRGFVAGQILGVLIGVFVTQMYWHVGLFAA